MAFTAVEPAKCGDQIVGPRAILHRLRDKDKSAVEDCLNRYGGLVWSLSKKYTESVEDAESMTMKIFEDVWRHTLRNGRNIRTTEEFFIAFLACQRLSIRSSVESNSLHQREVIQVPLGAVSTGGF